MDARNPVVFIQQNGPPRFMNSLPFKRTIQSYFDLKNDKICVGGAELSWAGARGRGEGWGDCRRRPHDAAPPPVQRVSGSLPLSW